MVLPIYNVLCKIDDNTINAAEDLGANFFQTLFYIWLPSVSLASSAVSPWYLSSADHLRDL